MNLACPSQPVVSEALRERLSNSTVGQKMITMLENRTMNVLFQPIVDIKQQRIFGYEALARGPANSNLHQPLDLFQAASACDCLFEIDWLARSVAIESFFRQSNDQSRLFLNVTINSLMARGHQRGMTLDILADMGVPLDRVIIELTEHHPVDDFKLFVKSVLHYRQMGFQVALDDLGGGYNGLRLWSELGPEFVKIDKHFVHGLAENRHKRHFIRTICALAEDMGTHLVAEGVEHVADLEVLESMGVGLAQGYWFARPAPELMPQTQLPKRTRLTRTHHQHRDDLSGLLLPTDTIAPQTPVYQVTNRFLKENQLDFLPVVESGRVLGIVWRRAFMDMMAKRYSFELFHRRPITELMDHDPIVVDVTTPVERLSRLITDRHPHHQGDAFVITDHQGYRGCGRFLDLLRLITDLKVQNAQYANPLSGLPGNVPINQEIQKHLERQQGFVVVYVDADNFKAYNDHYSYDQGDDVIRLISQLLGECHDPQPLFIGHIGGDDFMVILDYHADYPRLCNAILTTFNQRIRAYYRPEDLDNNGIKTVDRAGKPVTYNLISLSLGVLCVPPGVTAHQQKLASLATRAKKRAKQAGGNTWSVVHAEDECPTLQSLAD